MLRKLIIRFSVNYLRKNNVSVVIGMEMKQGQLKAKNGNFMFYDNTGMNVEIKDCRGNVLRILSDSSKFSYKYSANKKKYERF